MTGAPVESARTVWDPPPALFHIKKATRSKDEMKWFEKVMDATKATRLWTMLRLEKRAGVKQR
jgi:hypothetical protein